MAGGRAAMSMIEGDGDGDGDGGVCGDADEEVKDADVAGNRDGLFDVNVGWGTRAVSKSSNGHQSNDVNGAPDWPNKNVVVSCLTTPRATATIRPTQMRIGRAVLPKYIVYRPRDDEVGLEGP